MSCPRTPVWWSLVVIACVFSAAMVVPSHAVRMKSVAAAGEDDDGDSDSENDFITIPSSTGAQTNYLPPSDAVVDMAEAAAQDTAMTDASMKAVMKSLLKAFEIDAEMFMWTEPSDLVGEWRVKDASVQPFGYMMDNSGVVHFRGMIEGHKVGPLFILPTGMRPSQPIRELAVTNDNKLAYIEFATDGKIKVFCGRLNNSWFTLYGMSYFSIPDTRRDDNGIELPPLSPFAPAALVGGTEGGYSAVDNAAPGYFKDGEGFVHLRGHAQKGTGGNGKQLFKTKNGDTPDKNVLLLAIAGEGAGDPNKLHPAVIKISDTSVGVLNYEQVPHGSWLSLDGLTYRNKLQDLGWLNLQLSNGWSHQEQGNYNTAGYYLDDSGWVHLKGVIKGGTDDIAFTLPERARPTKMETVAVAAVADPYYAVMQIAPSGEVSLLTTGAKGGTTSLDGVQFRIHMEAPPPPKCTNQCLFGGTVNEDICQCECVQGRGGPTCEDIIVPPCLLDCQNGSYKDLNVCKCDCVEPWKGDECRQCGLTCMNGGTQLPIDCRCECINGWSGDTCETCDRKCDNDGQVDSATCTCKCPEYARGPTCSKTGYCYDQPACSPDTWGGLRVGNELCSSGQAQSPINVVVSTVETDEQLGPIEFKYSSGFGVISNEGRALYAKVNDGGVAEFNHQRFPLIKWVIHAPSEHTVDGVPTDVELQLHHLTGSGGYLTVNILFSKGEDGLKGTAELDQMLNILPEVDKVEKYENLDATTISELLGAEHHSKNSRLYYFYQGSTTTPPCREGVNALVMKTVLPISQIQLDLIHKAMPVVNARPVQSANGRHVSAPLEKAIGKQWTYGPDDNVDMQENKDVWGENGHHQSPINLIDMGPTEIAGYSPMPFHHPEIMALVTRYFDCKDHLTTVDKYLETRFTHRPASTIQLQGRAYDLRKMRIHSPALHSVNGARGQMEISLIHQHKDSERPDLIVSVLFKEGKASDIIDKLGLGAEYNPSEIMPDDPNFYMYDGSNTEENGEEGIRWIVMKQVRTATKEQMKLITGKDPAAGEVRATQDSARRLMVETNFPADSPTLVKTNDRITLNRVHLRAGPRDHMPVGFKNNLPLPAEARTPATPTNTAGAQYYAPAQARLSPTDVIGGTSADAGSVAAGEAVAGGTQAAGATSTGVASSAQPPNAAVPPATVIIHSSNLATNPQPAGAAIQSSNLATHVQLAPAAVVESLEA